jgi:hypothetical protein
MHMNQIALFYRLAGMRRTAGAGPVEALAWAGGLLWRARGSNHNSQMSSR